MLTPVPDDWRDGALCVGMGPSAASALFFPRTEGPLGGGTHRRPPTAAAMRAEEAVVPWCGACRVRVACLEAALDYGRECVGLWGGLGSAKRRHLSQARTRQQAEGHSPHRYTPGCSCTFCQLTTAYLAGEVLNRNTPGARCGYRSSYVRNCRCVACTYAAALHSRRSNTLEAA